MQCLLSIIYIQADEWMEGHATLEFSSSPAYFSIPIPIPFFPLLDPLYRSAIPTTTHNPRGQEIRNHPPPLGAEHGVAVKGRRDGGALRGDQPRGEARVVDGAAEFGGDELVAVRF